MTASTTQTTHSMVGHEIFTGIDFDTFRAGFEKAVPVFGKKAAVELVKNGGSRR